MNTSEVLLGLGNFKGNYDKKRRIGSVNLTLSDYDGMVGTVLLD